MASPVEPPAGLRQLGRSRIYLGADLPSRLLHWHSPRVNRWERLCVVASTLAIERLGAAGVTAERLAARESRWIAPGVRWRLTELSADAAFELEVHAEARAPEAGPQLLRKALLAEAVRAELATAKDLIALADGLAAGERRLIRGRFDWRAPLRETLRGADRTFLWHPLAADASGFVALVARSARPVGLAEYLARDHAVIEAALAGTLSGEAESTRWLQAALARHLAIEEELLFPAYVMAGGREAWVRGLENEHAHLRQYLAELEREAARRKFLRLLDGHDEKEERVVYPDILAHLNAAANDLLARAVTFPIPT